MSVKSSQFDPCMCKCTCSGCVALRKTWVSCDCAVCQALSQLRVKDEGHTCIMSCKCPTCIILRKTAEKCDCLTCQILLVAW